jgi:hypothetical protein
LCLLTIAAPEEQREQITYEYYNQDEQKEAFFDRKVDYITAGLQPRFKRYLKDKASDNALVICDYILAMTTDDDDDNDNSEPEITEEEEEPEVEEPLENEETLIGGSEPVFAQ